MVTNATRGLGETTNGIERLGKDTKGRDDATSEWGVATNRLDEATNELDKIEEDIPQ